jgi:hypothetical protein
MHVAFLNLSIRSNQGRDDDQKPHKTMMLAEKKGRR